MRRLGSTWILLGLLACDDGTGSDVDAGAAMDGAVEMAVLDATPAVPGWPPVIADNAVTPDDPLALGQAMFVYETWGLEASAEWPPAEFMLDLMVSQPDVFGDQYARFGFVPNPADDFPYGFTRGRQDPTKVQRTCGICHVARLPDGRIWLGAPNTALDVGAFRLAVDAAWQAAGNLPLITEDLQREKLAELGPGRTGAESGDYPQVVPADFPPYLSLAERPHLNHLGTGLTVKTEVYLSLYSAGLGNPTDAEAIQPFPPAEQTDPFVAFFGAMDPPAAPDIDAAAAERGRAVFDAAGCGACHHPDDPMADGVTPIDKADDGRDRMPGEEPDWPDGSIHTSPLHRVLIDGDGEGGGGLDAGRLQLIMFIGRHGLRIQPTDGYRVPTLAGLWATAPYLHNGAVPTLEALLSPVAERPTRFAVHGVERDTTRPGNSNRGHAFGVDLPAAEKADLIEFLRSR